MRAQGGVRWGSIRLRLTVVATVLVATVLTAGSVALVTLQRHQLTVHLDASLHQRADLLAVEFAGPSDSTAAATALNSIAQSAGDHAVQIVSADGVVLAATANLRAAGPLADPLTPGVDEVIQTRLLTLDDDPYRVLSRRVPTADDPVVLHVAETRDSVVDPVAALTATLAVGGPAVLLILAGLSWWLTGRALGPVDTMRKRVDVITASDANQRIDVPDRDDEITRLAVTLNRMLDRLSETADRQRRFVADAAHELRTPLTRIRTEVEVDIDQPDRADPQATNRRVRHEVAGMQQLVDDLLHLARSSADPATSTHRPVDLDDIVMREIRHRREAGPEVRIDAHQVSAASLKGNPDHLARAVRNLLDNAARHAAALVTVSVAQPDRLIELAVADDGPGVPAEDRERIFERFTRLDDARSRHEGGAGLGLAITREIVERHGGTVRYDHHWHGGARFVVTLPGEPPPAA